MNKKEICELKRRSGRALINLKKANERIKYLEKVLETIQRRAGWHHVLCSMHKTPIECLKHVEELAKQGLAGELNFNLMQKFLRVDKKENEKV